MMTLKVIFLSLLVAAFTAVISATPISLETTHTHNGTHFDLQRRVWGPQDLYGPTGQPSPDDVEQQNDSCWLAAALKLIAHKDPKAISKTLITQGSTVVSHVQVKLPGQKAQGFASDIVNRRQLGRPKQYYYDMGDPRGPWWVAAVEAAVYHAVGPTLETKQRKDKKIVYCGGGLHTALEAVLGGRWSVHNPNDPASVSWDDIESKYATDMNTMAILGTRHRTEAEIKKKVRKTFNVNGQEVYFSHAYGVLSFNQKFVTLLNPHSRSPAEGITVDWEKLKPEISGIAIRAGRR